MSKENILFGVIGLLLGCIIGFFFANSVNQRGYNPPQTSANATSQNPNLPPDHPPMASNGVADQSGMPAVVTETIQQARNNPNDFDAQMQAAALYYKINRYNEAIEYLLKANQIRPDDYDTVVRLGDANFDAGNYPTSEKWYTAALVKNPNDINVRTDLGLTFLFREPPDVDRAIKEFRTSLQRDPQHELTLQNLSAALIKKGDATEAQATLDKLQAVNPSNPALTKLRADLTAIRAASSKKS